MEHELDGRKIPVHIHEDYIQRPPSRTCVVVGDQGRISLDFHALSIRVWDGKGQLTKEESFAGFDRNQLFIDEMQHFLACVEGKEKSVVTLHDGMQSLRMALASKESLESGKVVDLI
jgi:predicted dehydrogenase